MTSYYVEFTNSINGIGRLSLGTSPLRQVLSFAEVNHRMLLIYIFLKMPKNLPCTEWIFIRPKWVEVEFESVRVENASCLGLGECGYQHRRVRQRSSCLSRQTAYQSICLAKDSEDLLQAKILLHQTSSEWCKSRTQLFLVDQVTLLVRSIWEYHWFQITHLSCCEIPLENRRGTSCVFPVDSRSNDLGFVVITLCLRLDFDVRKNYVNVRSYRDSTRPFGTRVIIRTIKLGNCYSTDRIRTSNDRWANEWRRAWMFVSPCRVVSLSLDWTDISFQWKTRRIQVIVD